MGILQAMESMHGGSAMKKPGGMAKAMSLAPPMHEGGGEHSELHDHGDGSFHTVTGGEQTEHPAIGHALMHLAAHHDGGAKHLHVKSDGMEHTSHEAGEDGQVQGPHDHQDAEALKAHVGKWAGGEHEASGYGSPSRGSAHESPFED